MIDPPALAQPASPPPRAVAAHLPARRRRRHALPLLESLPAFGDEPAGAAVTPPKRFAALFMGCGINSDHWWAKGAGDAMQLGKSLAPMERSSQDEFRHRPVQRPRTHVGIHPGQTGNILSAPPSRRLRAARRHQHGPGPRQPLPRRYRPAQHGPRCEQPITGYHETNFSMAYSSHISWQNATSPVPMEVYPALAFDSLFENRGSRRT